MTMRRTFIVLALLLSSCATPKQSRHPVVVTSSSSGEKFIRLEQLDPDAPFSCPTDPSRYKTLKNGFREVISVRGEDIRVRYCFLDSKGKLAGTSPKLDFKAEVRKSLTTVVWRDAAGIAIHPGVVGTALPEDEKTVFKRVSYEVTLNPVRNPSLLEVSFREDSEEAAGGQYLGNRPAIDGPIVLLGMLHLNDGRKWMAIGARNPNQGPCPEKGCKPIPGDPHSCVRTRGICSLPTHFDGSRVEFSFPREIPPGRHRLTLKTLYRVMPEQTLDVMVSTK